jgi:hypothetical protein
MPVTERQILKNSPYGQRIYLAALEITDTKLIHSHSTSAEDSPTVEWGGFQMILERSLSARKHAMDMHRESFLHVMRQGSDLLP